MRGNNEHFEIFERNKYLKKLPSMQRVNSPGLWNLGIIFKNTRFYIIQLVSRSKLFARSDKFALFKWKECFQKHPTLL